MALLHIAAGPSRSRISESGPSPLFDRTIPLLRRQRRVRMDWVEVQAFLDLSMRPVAGGEYSVCIVSDRSMRRYNRQFRSRDEATDVLSFPTGPGDESGYLGDIIISAETARRNARRYGVRLEDEIKLLVLHGVLHLLGHDHEKDHGRMARCERQWAVRLGLPQSVIGRVQRKAGRKAGGFR